MSWFEIDRAGLRAQLLKRGKAFAVYELVQNAWDSGADEVTVELVQIVDGLGRLTVKDNSEQGFIRLEDAYTMFAPSTSATDVCKRGRFNTGEKAVLALCERASIITTTGTLVFDADSGRTRTDACQARGTTFMAELEITADEILEVGEAMEQLIPPIPTSYNGVMLVNPQLLHTFEIGRLQTEYAAKDGILRRTYRKATIEVYAGDGWLLELGIPVVPAELGYRVNVLQKVPLNSDRDNVPPSFVDHIAVEVINEMADTLTDEEATEPWVQKALADGRIKKGAFDTAIRKRFGDKAVFAVPGDPQANAAAEAAGYHVIHGRTMSADMRSNAKKYETLERSADIFPGLKPDELAQTREGKCPTCGRSLANKDG